MHLRVAALDGKSGVVDWEAEVEEAAVGDGDEGACWLVWRRRISASSSSSFRSTVICVNRLCAARCLPGMAPRIPGSLVDRRAAIIRPSLNLGKLPAKSPLALDHSQSLQ